MARNRQKPKPPFLRPGARAPKRLSVMSQLQKWFRTYPALSIAYAEIRQRFHGSAGICGIGVGRKFSERTGQYGTAPDSTGGLCIKVFVKKKKRRSSGKITSRPGSMFQCRGRRRDGVFCSMSCLSVARVVSDRVGSSSKVGVGRKQDASRQDGCLLLEGKTPPR